MSTVKAYLVFVLVMIAIMAWADYSNKEQTRLCIQEAVVAKYTVAEIEKICKGL